MRKITVLLTSAQSYNLKTSSTTVWVVCASRVSFLLGLPVQFISIRRSGSRSGMNVLARLAAADKSPGETWRRTRRRWLLRRVPLSPRAALRWPPPPRTRRTPWSRARQTSSPRPWSVFGSFSLCVSSILRRLPSPRLGRCGSSVCYELYNVEAVSLDTVISGRRNLLYIRREPWMQQVSGRHCPRKLLARYVSDLARVFEFD